MPWLAIVPLLLLVLAGGPGTTLAAAQPPGISNDCVERADAARSSALRAAERGEFSQARRRLAGALLLCPGQDDLLVDLAQLEIRAGAPERARGWAERAVHAAPERAERWDLLAAAHYLNDAPDRALDAWNRGTPRVLARVRVRTVGPNAPEPGQSPRIDGVHTGLEPGRPLDRASLEQARRRFDEIPAVEGVRLSWRVDERGDADVEAVVRIGGLRLPLGPALLVHAARLSGGEAHAHAVNVLGRLERWSAEARGRRGEVAVSAQLALPAAVGPGSWRWGADLQRVRVRIGGPSDGTEHVVRRGGIRWGTAHWWTARVRAGAEVGLEWRTGPTRHVRAETELLVRSLEGQFELRAAAARWQGIGEQASASEAPTPSNPAAAGRTFTRGMVSGELRSRSPDDPDAPSGTSVRGGLAALTEGAPTDLFPRVGAGAGIEIALRAHEGRTRRGALRDAPGASRIWAFSGVEHVHPLSRNGLFNLSVAAFVDWVHGPAIWRADPGPDPASAVAVGGGVRVRPAGSAGWLSIDIAVDPATGERRLSAGWSRG